MRTAFWESVVDGGYRLPGGRLEDLTSELVAMLGDPDPHVRDELAYAVLATWVDEGVYDDLLLGLGDGLVVALRAGLGEDGTDSVLRRSFAALVLAAVVVRDSHVHALHPHQVLAWADRALAWFPAERDLRGRDPRLGWVHAVAHGADLLGALAGSRHLAGEELVVLLDVVADRLLRPTTYCFQYGEDDRLGLATMAVLHRDLVDVEACETWLARLQAPFDDGTDPFAPVPANVAAYVRALHLQLLLGVDRTPTQWTSLEPGRPPAVRGDLLLSLQALLRRTAPHVLRQS